MKSNSVKNSNILRREQYFELIRAGLTLGEVSFSRDLILKWLIYYPGDLYASLLYAKTLFMEQRFDQAIHVLSGILLTDPEFREAAELLLTCYITRGNEKGSDDEDLVTQVATHVLALGGNIPSTLKPLPWGEDIRQVRSKLSSEKYHQVKERIRAALIEFPNEPIIMVTHLEYLDLNANIKLDNKIDIGSEYRQRIPDCVLNQILLADWLMESGEIDKAVAYLHDAATKDIDGQVPKRWWGEKYLYQSIWPDTLELDLSIPIPGKVSALLSWNRLTVDETDIVVEPNIAHDYDNKTIAEDSYSPDHEDLLNLHDEIDEELLVLLGQELDSRGDKGDDGLTHKSENDSHDDFDTIQDSIQPESVNQIRKEMKLVGRKWKINNASNWDGRFPVYVIFTVRRRLEEKYGVEKAAQIHKAMMNLVNAVQRRKGWEALLLYADEPDERKVKGLKPTKSDDPWSLKICLSDLDNVLAKRGEMIGTLLIIGGDDIVPFHRLPNPVDDPDEEVLSDNPYGTRDENYFIQEWSVGRLPDTAKGNSEFLIKNLEKFTEYHLVGSQKLTWTQQLIQWFKSWLRAIGLRQLPSVGYSAAVWQAASLSVFKPVGEKRNMFVSPPIGIIPTNGNSKKKRSKDKNLNLPPGKLGYYNLHGLVDSAEWYGQCEPQMCSVESEYPVALRPIDIYNNGNKRKKPVPRIVFTEACYGVNIQDREVDESIALKFIESGTLALIGSMCMSYGSIKPPLIAADLIGFSFWNYLREGHSAGESLRKARIYYSEEMEKRQGYLDGEDQKTLISFILLGDPLAEPGQFTRIKKSIIRDLESKTTTYVSSRYISPSDNEPISNDVTIKVKKMVSKYLPGMQDGKLIISFERSAVSNSFHGNGKSFFRRKANPKIDITRKIVTLSKQVVVDKKVHKHIARFTLNDRGKIVKMTLSR